MKYFFFSLLAAGLLGSLAGCQKTPVAPTEPLVCTFQLLNEQGQEATTFAAGQNVVFRYELRNTTDQEMYLQPSIFEPTAFLEVFSNASSPAQSVGTPYSGGLCTAYRAFYVLPAHGALTLTTAWVAAPQYLDNEPFCQHAANVYLPKGHYHTAVVPRLSWHYGGEPDTKVALAAQDYVRRFEVR